jgi:quercetin dioxygenase-like cupin family protein
MRDPAFDTLLSALADLCRGEGRDAAEATAQALTTTQIPQPFGLRAPLPFDSAIQSLLSASPHPVAASLHAVLDRVPWGSNPVEGTGGIATNFFSVATLMGPEGPIPAHDLRLGLFWQSPDTYYPLHNHDADETYFILAGSVIWTAGEDTRPRLAGDAIHHPSLMPHAFQAGPEGFLALWRWSGDINTHSYAFLDDPALTA